MKITTYIFLSMMISAVLILAGDRLIIQRTINPPIPFFHRGESTYFMKIGGDTDVYARMAKGTFFDAPAPYRYRILLPFIARYLPFEPHISFKLFSYFSLFALYVLLAVLCRSIAMSPAAAFVSLFAFFVTPWQLYMYHNPFYFDAFSLLLATTMILAYVRRWYALFFAMGIIGIFSRENIIFLTPWWFMTGQHKRGALVVLAIAVLFILTRTLLSNAPAQPAQQWIDEFYKIHTFTDMSRLSFWGTVAYVWGGFWLLGFAGLLLLPCDLFLSLGAGFLLAFCGAIVSSFFAEMPRMMLYLLPFMLCFCIPILSLLLEKRLFFFFIFAPLLIAKLFSGMGNIMLGWDSWMFASFLPRGIILGSDVFISIWILYLLKNKIHDGFREKKELLANIRIGRSSQ